MYARKSSRNIKANDTVKINKKSYIVQIQSGIIILNTTLFILFINKHNVIQWFSAKYHYNS